MELIILPPGEPSCTIPLDGIDYDLFVVNANYAESVTKTYSLSLEIPLSLFPIKELASYMVPAGSYSATKLDGILSDGAVQRPCTVVFESQTISPGSKGGVISLSVEYSDLPLNIMSKKIKDMDLGTWRFDQPLSTWAQEARKNTDGLISFPMIYAPEFFKNNYDDKFEGDTDYINRKRVRRWGGEFLYHIFHIYAIRPDVEDPDYVELRNDNAVIPCIHLLTLLRKIFDLSGYHLDTTHLPAYMEEVYLSTLQYPELEESPEFDIVQEGINEGEKDTALGDLTTVTEGNDWIFFEQYIDIPRQFSGCTVTVTLNSGSLYPCLVPGRPERYAPTVFKCVMDNTDGSGMVLDESLLRETIEEVTDLDKSKLKYTFQFTREQRGNGYMRPRIQLRGSNVYEDKPYPENVKPPYVEDLQAIITYEFDHQKTYEIFLRPQDYSSYVEIKTTDYIAFETVADLYTALKNTFGISFSMDAYSRVVTAQAASDKPKLHDLQEYSPRTFVRNYNASEVDQINITVIRAANENSPVVVIYPSRGIIIYENTAAYEREKDQSNSETVKETGFYPLRTKRQIAAFEKDGMGKNNIFFAPLYGVEGIDETNTALAKIEVDGKTITLEPDSLYETALKYILNSLSDKESYEIQTYVPAYKFFQINSPDKIYICNREFDIVELHAESSGNGFILTINALG